MKFDTTNNKKSHQINQIKSNESSSYINVVFNVYQISAEIQQQQQKFSQLTNNRPAHHIGSNFAKQCPLCPPCLKDTKDIQ